MMNTVHLDVQLRFDTTAEQDTSEDFLLRILGAVARIDALYLRENPDTPKLYDSGVTYALPDQLTVAPIGHFAMNRIVKLLQREGVDAETCMAVVRRLRGVEICRDIPTIRKRGRSDCNDLTCWRIAELWNAGEKYATPYLEKAPNERGGITYHAVVKWADGSIEDPSAILGMDANETEGLARRASEIDKNLSRHAALSLMMGDASKYGCVPKKGFKPQP